MSDLLNDKNSDFNSILFLINEARNRAFSAANSELVGLYFNVGRIVSDKVFHGSWGDNTVQELSDFIQSKHPELMGFNRRGLYRMKQMYETYSTLDFLKAFISYSKNNHIEKDVVQNKDIDYEKTLEFFSKNYLVKVGWTHHRLIISKAKSDEERLYYLMISIKERYSSRDLERALNTAQFERVMLSNTIVSAVQTQIPEGVFKDPYIFEFLNIPETHSEKDFEKAIILNLQKFILEVGKGFTYMGNQFRLQVGNKDYFTDLLFYHRDLQCLVLFELKIQEFEPEFLGKLNFYLEALDQDIKRPYENPSIGILLCKGKDTEVVKYAIARSTSPAVIAEYETKLIDKKLLAEKLHHLSEVLSKNNDQPNQN